MYFHLIYYKFILLYFPIFSAVFLEILETLEFLIYHVCFTMSEEKTAFYIFERQI